MAIQGTKLVGISQLFDSSRPLRVLERRPLRLYQSDGFEVSRNPLVSTQPSGSSLFGELFGIGSSLLSGIKGLLSGAKKKAKSAVKGFFGKLLGAVFQAVLPKLQGLLQKLSPILSLFSGLLGQKSLP